MHKSGLLGLTALTIVTSFFIIGCGKEDDKPVYSTTVDYVGVDVADSGASLKSLAEKSHVLVAVLKPITLEPGTTITLGVGTTVFVGTENSLKHEVSSPLTRSVVYKDTIGSLTISSGAALIVGPESTVYTTKDTTSAAGSKTAGMSGQIILADKSEVPLDGSGGFLIRAKPASSLRIEGGGGLTVSGEAGVNGLTLSSGVTNLAAVRAGLKTAAVKAAETLETLLKSTTVSAIGSVSGHEDSVKFTLGESAAANAVVRLTGITIGTVPEAVLDYDDHTASLSVAVPVAALVDTDADLKITFQAADLSYGQIYCAAKEMLVASKEFIRTIPAVENFRYAKAQLAEPLYAVYTTTGAAVALKVTTASGIDLKVTTSAALAYVSGISASGVTGNSKVKVAEFVNEPDTTSGKFLLKDSAFVDADNEDAAAVLTTSVELRSPIADSIRNEVFYTRPAVVINVITKRAK